MLGWCRLVRVPNRRDLPIGLVLVVALAFSLAACTSGRSMASPTSTASPTFSGPTWAQLSAWHVKDQQRALSSDYLTVMSYGRRHGDLASVRFSNGRTVKLEVHFLADVARHRAALRPLLRHPGLVDILQAPQTPAQVNDLRIQMRHVLDAAGNDPRLRAAKGDAMGAVSAIDAKTTIPIPLPADDLGLAERLYARFGDAADITLGALTYPPSRYSFLDYNGKLPGEDLPPGSTLTCGSTPRQLAPSISARVTLSPASEQSGGDIGGTLTLHNSGSTALPLAVADTDQHGRFLFDAWVLDRPGGKIIATWTGARSAVGYLDTLEPGKSFSGILSGSTTPCEPGLGYTLPPGKYPVVAHVAYANSGPPQTQPGTNRVVQPIIYLVTEPVTLTLR